MDQLAFFNDSNELKSGKIFLDKTHYLEIHRAISLFKIGSIEFQELWNKHPEEFHEVIMHGKRVKTPRWQQAYGKNYEYTGAKNNALPLDLIDEKYLHWCQENIDPRLNGLLLNWYEGKEKHYIGKHRDSIKGLEKDSTIVTISHGEERVFRLRPHGGSGYQDFLLKNGDVVIIPWQTNKYFTHEVPHFSKYTSRRISVTVRAYSG